MSTLKYKATERYAMGWSDPRVVFKNRDFSVDTLHPPGHVTTDYTDVPTETLRNLWMARFGSRAVEKQDMYVVREEPIAEMAQELVNRRLVSVQIINRMEIDATLHYYVLEREHGNS
jgi:hypothetical protein